MTLTRFRESPFIFNTLESVIIFLIGSIISILAVAKGYSHDDRYPRYGQIDRLHKERDDAYVQKETEVRDTLIKVLNDSEVKQKKIFIGA